MLASIADTKIDVSDCLDERIAAFIWGPVGIGKSEAVAQLARARRAAQIALLKASRPVSEHAAIDAADRAYPCFIDIRLGMFDPVDLRGLPCNVDGKTAWLRPALWPTENPYGLETIIFFDEMDRAPLAVLNASLQIVLDYRIGEHELPPTVRVIAAGNGSDDKGTTKLTKANCNRFAHFHVGYSPSAMVDHFIDRGVHPLMVAFYKLRPELGYQEPEKGENAFSTPRQNVKFNAFLDPKYDDARRMRKGVALIGSAVTAEFEAFFRLFRDFTPINEIIANPDTAPIPGESSAHWAVAVALARAAKIGNFGKIQDYLKRLPAEFDVMANVDATTRDAALKLTGPYRDFAIRRQEVLA